MPSRISTRRSPAQTGTRFYYGTPYPLVTSPRPSSTDFIVAYVTPSPRNWPTFSLAPSWMTLQCTLARFYKRFNGKGRSHQTYAQATRRFKYSCKKSTSSIISSRSTSSTYNINMHCTMWMKQPTIKQRTFSKMSQKTRSGAPSAYAG